MVQLILLWIFFVSLSSCVFFFLHLTGSILLCSPHLSVFFILHATAQTFGLFSFLTIFTSYFLSECPHFSYSFSIVIALSTLSLSPSVLPSLSRSLSLSLFSKLHFAHKLKNSKNRILVKEIFWIFHLAFKKIERCKKEFGEKQVLRLSLNLKLHKIQQFYFHDDWSRSQWLEHSTESCEFESRTEHPRFPFDPTFCCTFIESVFNLNQSVTRVLLGALC